MAPLGMERQQLSGIASSPRGREAASRFKRLLGLDEAAWARLGTWSATPSRTRVLGTELHANLVDFSRRRFCPGCLADAPFHRAAWDVVVLPGCALHRTSLSSECSVCGALPRWTRSWPHLCSGAECRAELSEQAVGADLDEEAVGVCTRVAALVNGDVPPGNAPLSAGDTLAAAARLGSFALEVPWKSIVHCAPDGLGQGRVAQTVLADVMGVGLAALAEWPKGLHAYVKALRAGKGARRGRHGANKDLGPIVGWFRDERESSVGEVVCPEVDAWMADQAEMTTRVMAVGLIRGAGEAAVLTVAQAAKRFGIGPGVVRSVVERHGLYTVAPDGKGRGALIDAAALEKVLAEIGSAIDRRTAAAFLGVGKLVLVEMLGAGLIRELPERQRVLKTLSLDRAALEAFVAGLEKAAKEPGPVEGALPLKDAATGVPGGIVRLLVSVAAGRIRPAGVDLSAKGLNRLQFALADRPPPRRTIPADHVAPGDLATMLGIDRTSMTEMVGAGLFGPGEAGAWHRRARPVSLEAVERFRRECAMVPEIAAEAGLPWQGVAERLRRLGVEAVSGPATDGLRRNVFRRSDIELVMPKLKAQAGAAPTKRSREHRSERSRQG